MLFGLALGLIVALVVYVRSERDGGARAPAAASPVRGEPAPAAIETGENRVVTPPADARFDFYELLPQFEVVIPEVEPDTRRDSVVRAVDAPGSYILQVGSFSSMGDADRRQASLALLGIESRIQRVTIDDDVFHRVRIGPIAALDELNRVRRQLRDARLEALLVRVKD